MTTMSSRFTRAAVCGAVVALGCRGGGTAEYTVVERYPHDPSAYTQGLVLVGDVLYESTGQYGESQIRRIDRATGRVLSQRRLAPSRFGEGLAYLDGKLYQLTWKAGVAYVYDAVSLTPLDSFAYEGEGWGLTTDGDLLIMSDGTATLRFRDPATFDVVREVVVTDGGSPLAQLNELESVRGVLYANVYGSDWIVAIDPATGVLLEWLDLAELYPERERPPGTDVLNGIAFDSTTGHFFVTGKLWPTLFELRLRDEAR
jgi:glutamine cyclotransferase